MMSAGDVSVVEESGLPLCVLAAGQGLFSGQWRSQELR